MANNVALLTVTALYEKRPIAANLVLGLRNGLIDSKYSAGTGRSESSDLALWQMELAAKILCHLRHGRQRVVLARNMDLAGTEKPV